MTRRIFRSIILVAMTVLLASLGLIMTAMYSYSTAEQFAQLRVETALASHAVSNEGISYFEKLDNTMSCRITWIDTDGTVLYDNRTDSDTMENHLERQEVQDALASGYGQSSRYSATLMEQSIYAAERLPDGTVLRLSNSHNSILTLVLGMSQHICIVIAVTLVLSLVLAKRLSRAIVRPLNELDLDNPLAADDYEELSPLLRRIDSQQRQLQGQTTELKRKQREFDTVTNNMNEGLVLMNQHCHVLTMNAAAARLVGLSRPFVGINFLSVIQVPAIAAIVNKALTGIRAEGTVTLPDGDYQVNASPVKSGGQVSGVVQLILDITEKQKAERQRREFTANVSHELKSPLHVIFGYAELLKSGLVRSEDVGGFSDRIYTETQRLIRLVEDILRLSRLDEGATDTKWEPVDLYTLAQDMIRGLQPTADRAGVTLTLVGTHARVTGTVQSLSGIISNLCTNAIKYNRPGGTVTVDIQDWGQESVLSVADTGIGIAPEHQERIFERFYRVDKSHSKAVGGTGLGLSIVKHSAMILGAKIELDSTPGEGTTIRVRFPK